MKPYKPQLHIWFTH